MTDKYEALCELLMVDAEHHKEVAHDMDMPPENAINWAHGWRCEVAVKYIRELKQERDTLAAKLADLEKQEPVELTCAECGLTTEGRHFLHYRYTYDKGQSPPKKLYLAPGAQSQDAQDAARYRWLREDSVEVDEVFFSGSHDVLDAAIDAAMAQGAK
jgi:hypothetical protein